jgi:hypothetical protein
MTLKVRPTDALMGDAPVTDPTPAEIESVARRLCLRARKKPDELVTTYYMINGHPAPVRQRRWVLYADQARRAIETEQTVRAAADRE